MTEKEQKNKLYDFFNKEQGVFTYYTCGLQVLMIGYLSNIIIESSKHHLILPLIGVFAMFISLYFGIYFLKYRLSNYYNDIFLLDIIEKSNDKDMVEKCKKTIDENGKKQSQWYKLHWWSLGVGPAIIFAWLFMLTLNL